MCELALEKGASIAEDILRRIQADPDSIYSTPIRAAHRGDTARIGKVVNTYSQDRDQEPLRLRHKPDPRTFRAPARFDGHRLRQASSQEVGNDAIVNLEFRGTLTY